MPSVTRSRKSHRDSSDSDHRRRRKSRHRSRRSSRDSRRSRDHYKNHRRKRSASSSYLSSSYSSSSSDSEVVEEKEKPKKMIDPTSHTPIFPLDEQRMTIKEKMQHQAMITANPTATRMARRVYIGNLPTNLKFTETILLDFFTILIKFHGINTPQPVLSVWLSDPPAFCFLDMRSVSDTAKCITLLDNMNLGERNLKVGRPPDYTPAPIHLSNFVVGAVPLGFNIFKTIVDPAAHKGRKQSSRPQKPKNRNINVPFPATSGTRVKGDLIPVKIRPTIDGGTLVNPAFPEDAELVNKNDPTKMKREELFADLPGDLREAFIEALPSSVNIEPSLLDVDVLPSRPCPPSLVIAIDNMVRAEELVKNDEYTDILYDIRLGAQRYGDVASVVIPRPGHSPGEFG
ncbi:hypothetical protein MHBO_002514, partial [Bonamia ostreae]